MINIPHPEAAFKKMIKNLSFQNKCVFFFSLALGFIAHGYVFVNTMHNHDNLDGLYTDNNMLISGRWFLKYASMLSSKISMPWVNGCISALLLAIAVLFVVKTLRVKSTIGGIVLSALMITFPTITGTLTYMFTADAYFISLLLACVAASLSMKYKLGFIPGGILLGLSVGTYQAYLPLTAALLCICLLLELLYGDLKFKQFILKCIQSILTLLIGLTVYFVVLRIMLMVKNIQLVDYQGINKMGMISFSELPALIEKSFMFPINFWSKDAFGVNGALERHLFYIMQAISCIIIISSVIKKRLYKSIWKLIFIVVMILVIPVACGIINIMVPVGGIHILMCYPVLLLYALPLILTENAWATEHNEKTNLLNVGKTLICWIVILAISYTSFGYYRFDNKIYIKMQTAYEQCYAFSVRLASTMEKTDGYYLGMPVLIKGRISNNPFAPKNPDTYNVSLLGAATANQLIDSYSYDKFQKYYLGFQFNCYTTEEQAALEEKYKQQIAEMPAYPEDGYMKAVDGIMIIKFSE